MKIATALAAGAAAGGVAGKSMFQSAEAGGRERRAGGTGTGFGVDCHHAGNTGLYII